VSSTGLLSRGLLYARTARNLRWQQWVYRAVRRVQARRGIRFQIAIDAVPARTAGLAEAVCCWWEAEPASLRRADEIVGGVFRFLNHAESIPAVSWDRRYVSHLWSYNLHYFDYALDLARAFRSTGETPYAQHFAALAESWISGTTAGRGDGWEPYPVSLRVVNWLYALLLCGDAIDARQRSAIEASAAQQLGFLERRLEYHILANHLQKNLKALVIGGLYFDGPHAERWLRRGSRLLWRELFEQVLADGGHFERSPMYHAIALADFLEVMALMDAAGQPVPSEARARVARMVEAFGVLSRADGRLHLFNDAANGIAPPRSWIDAMAKRVVGGGVPDPGGIVSLPDTGYYGLVLAADGARLLIDCGEPGPRYQPGHAHCDLLSFELDVGGESVVVDSGVSGYEGDALREYVRSTRAHNTVLIGGMEQAEIWGVFRMARRPRVYGAKQQLESGVYRFSGSYSPYHGRNIQHAREVEHRGGTWTITDRVRGAEGAALTSFLHLHPDVIVEPLERAFRLRTRSRTLLLEPFGVDAAAISAGVKDPPQGWYCPEFGVAVPNQVLVMHVSRNSGREFGFVIREAGTISQ